MLSFSFLSLFLAGIVLFAGAFIQGIVGFAMGLLAVPVWLMIFPQTLVRSMMLVLSVVGNLILLSLLWRRVNWQIVIPILIGAAAGSWPGTLIPLYMPIVPFKIFVGVFIVLAGVVLISGWRHPVSSLPQRIAVGFLSGLLNGCISLSGPPTATFLSAGNVDRNAFRASLSVFFFSLNLVTLTIVFLSGELRELLPVIDVLPFYAATVALGTLLGMSVGKRLAEGSFHKAVDCLILLSGAYLVLTTIF